MRLIDADKLIEEIESYRGDIFASEIVELIKQMPTVGEWIHTSQPPNVFDEHGQSEDVIVKLEWFDDDITYFYWMVQWKIWMERRREKCKCNFMDAVTVDGVIRVISTRRRKS